MINKNLLLKIADYIEQHPEEYDQSTFGTNSIISNVVSVYQMQKCNTPCCIAGLACMLSEQEGVELNELEYIDNEAAKLLNIDFNEMHVLFSKFYWEDKNIDWRTETAKVVEHLRKIANSDILIIE